MDKNRKLLFSLAMTCLLVLCGNLANAQSGTSARPKQRPKLSSRVTSRDTIERKGVLTSFPTNFAASTLKLGYEFRLSSNKGLKLIASYGSANSSTNMYGNLNNTYYNVNSFKEFGFEGQFRFYITKDRPALNGLYLAPYLSYKSMSYTYTVQNGYVPTISTSSSVSNFSVGYVLGYQIIYNSSFTLDLFVGGGLNSISGNNTQGNLASDIFAYYPGIMIHPGIGLGIAF